MCLISAILLLGLLSGCSKQDVSERSTQGGNSSEIEKGSPIENQNSNYINIKPAQAKKRLDGEKGIVLLDVRTQEEYNEGHLKGAVLIPVDILEAEVGKKLPDKDAVIFVYCRSGHRSAVASGILVDLGYKNVYNLGGIRDWPYEIEK